MTQNAPAAQPEITTRRAMEMHSNWPQRTFEDWLPRSGYEMASKPGYILEVYDTSRFKSLADPGSELDIWVPIRPTGE